MASEARGVLTTPDDVVRALVRFADVVDPRTGSLIVASSRGPDPEADPFRPGFLSGLEERDELVRRLERLDGRERRLLVLWYVLEWPVTSIARSLRVSRQHCYRLRRRALERAAALEPVQ